LVYRSERRAYSGIFENSVLRSISGSKTEIITGGRIKQLHEELHALHSPKTEMKDPSSITSAWQVARMDNKRNAYEILMGKGDLESLCVHRRIILKLILKKMDDSLWTRIIWFISE
jgi:hypothetical protein